MAFEENATTTTSTSFETVFTSETDGDAPMVCEVQCDDASAVPVTFRVVGPMETDSAGTTLQPGERAPFNGASKGGCHLVQVKVASGTGTFSIRALGS